MWLGFNRVVRVRGVLPIRTRGCKGLQRAPAILGPLRGRVFVRDPKTFWPGPPTLGVTPLVMILVATCLFAIERYQVGL